jgi:Leucine-rich repeat (LRR) protein
MKAFNLKAAQEHKERVTELYLHGLGLTEWPVLLRELPRLEVLCLSSNRLRAVPELLMALDHLEVLDLSGNCLQSLPPFLAKMERLREVNLARNEFARFPAVLGKIRGLQRIDLSGNRLLSLPQHLGNAAGLRALCLGHNRIKALPEKWGDLERLEELHLEHNRLMSIPGWLAGLPALRTLNLAQNRLTSLPEKLGDLENLEVLNLGYNRLEALPGSISRMRELRRLWLDHNDLGGLPEAMGNLPALRLLSCKHNRIGRWPAFLGALPRLETLELGCNELGTLPQALGNWPALEYLGLQHNGLAALPAAIAALPRLKELQLGRNRFERFPEVLVGAPRLEKAGGAPGAAQAIRFIQACQRNGLSGEHCAGLFALWSGAETAPGQLPAQTLQHGLRLGLPSLQKIIVGHLLKLRSSDQEQGRKELAWVGKTRLSKAQWQERLQGSRWTEWAGASGKPSHVVVGTGSLDIPAEWMDGTVAFLEEAGLHQYLLPRKDTYLGEEHGAQLRQLLHSRQEASIRLALTLLRNGGAPRGLMTDLFWAWKFTKEGSLKRSLRDLLMLHASEAGRRFLEKAPQTPSSLAQLEALCRDTEFDAARLWTWWSQVSS